MSTTPEILTGPFRVNTTGSAAEPQAVVMGNGNLVVAYISERIGQQTTDAFFVRGQQFDFDGNRIGEEALFLSFLKRRTGRILTSSGWKGTSLRSSLIRIWGQRRCAVYRGVQYQRWRPGKFCKRSERKCRCQGRRAF
ncbi:hypothetical protein [uncultured Roseobacter sp.]|uniref:hypothetical protein n=1 Tax=uncultured Roseobacter sp. TaxID=114847 RepID=UPI00261766E8|nr:hypothetical protein [uncultured Roseobacter sp.]